MSKLSIPEQADAILTSKRRVNWPHPDEPSKRVIGWVVDEDKIGLGVGLLALEEVERRALRK